MSLVNDIILMEGHEQHVTLIVMLVKYLYTNSV